MALADNTETNNMKNSESKVFTREDLFDSLTDLNTGFDSPLIKHFSEKDFITIMNRCKENKVDIYGIESFTKNGECIHCIVDEMFEDYDDTPWYLKAFEDFKNKMTNFAKEYNIQIIYTASYSLKK
jgi:hypothetical protein